MRTTTCSILAASALFALAACNAASNRADQAKYNEHTPGWTGTTLVAGSNSTIAGDAEATYLQQKWGSGGRQR